MHKRSSTPQPCTRRTSILIATCFRRHLHRRRAQSPGCVAAADVESFVFTSATSVFRRCTRPAGGPVACASEEIKPIPKTSMASPRRPQKMTASCSIGNQGCFALCSTRDFSPRRITTRWTGGFCRRQEQCNGISQPARRSRRCSSRALVTVERAPEMGFGRCIIGAATPFLSAICGLAPRCPAGGVPSCPRLRDGPCALRLGHGFQD